MDKREFEKMKEDICKKIMDIEFDWQEDINDPSSDNGHGEINRTHNEETLKEEMSEVIYNH